GTPPLAPLDHYEQEVKDGFLYLGKAKPKGEG
ncbi:menaquinol-cytochrome C reductase, partial [Bacillus subtilis]